RLSRLSAVAPAVILGLSVLGTGTPVLSESTNPAVEAYKEHMAVRNQAELIKSVMESFVVTSVDPNYFADLYSALENPRGYFERKYDLGHKDYPSGFTYMYFPNGGRFYSFLMFVEDTGSNTDRPSIVSLNMQLNSNGGLYNGNGDFLPLLVENPEEKAGLDVIKETSNTLFNIPSEMRFYPWVFDISGSPVQTISMSRNYQDGNSGYFQYADDTGLIGYTALLIEE
ncbi:MAG: hypothetical protein COU25_01630, partial [Candidatus Levybacteria bacterium CG10_big_fil_rev_8_21_14_0_10_35_13]